MFEPLSYLEEKIRLTEDLKKDLFMYYRKYLEKSKDNEIKSTFRTVFWHLSNSLTDLSDSHMTILSLNEDSHE